MKPTRKTLGFIRKAYVSNTLTEKFIDEVMNIRGTMSRSQIIRDAIFEYRKKSLGSASYDSINMRLKQKELEKEEIEASLPPSEFAASINAPVVSDSTGKQWVMIGFMGNSIRCVDPAKIKELFKNNSDLLFFHQDYISKFGPIPAEFYDDVYPR